MNENNNFSVLIPLERTLNKEQVWTLYCADKLPYRLQEEDERVGELMAKAIHRTMKCRNYLAVHKTEDDVRTYYKTVFGGVMREEAIRCMEDKKLRTRFICEQVGTLLDKGIFFAKIGELAKALGYKNLQTDSLMRYIRYGRNK